MPPDAIDALPEWERREYVLMLEDVVEAEQNALDSAKSNSSVPSRPKYSRG